MDELDDRSAFGLAEIDEDRAAGEWDDPHAPAVGAVLTTERAEELATWGITGAQDLSSNEWQYLARTILAWAPIVAAAEAQADADSRLADALGGGRRRSTGPMMPQRAEWVYATRATESAVRAMRAAGGDA